MSGVHSNLFVWSGAESTNETFYSESRLQETNSTINLSYPQTEIVDLRTESPDPEPNLNEVRRPHVHDFPLKAGPQDVHDDRSMPMMVQPPPPPPVPQYQHHGYHPPPPFRPLETHSHVSPHEDFLERLEALQEGLRDVREDLVGARFRLRTKRRDLRQIQETVIQRVAAAFDHMRRHFLVNGLVTPDQIEAEWTEVDVARDTLGEKEIEYERAEKEYNMEEWRYTETEKQHFDSFFHDAVTTVSPTSGLPTVDIEEDLTRHSCDVADLTFTPAGQDGVLIPFESIRGTPDRRSSGGQYQGHIHEDPKWRIVAEHSAIAIHQQTAPVEKFSTPDIRDLTFASLLRESDESLGDSRSGRLSSLRHIENWMLGVLRASSSQQRQLELYVPRHAISNEAWFELVTRHWISSDFEDVDIHTGDTTVTGTALSQSGSSNSMKNLSDTSGRDDADTRPSSHDPMMPDGGVADGSASFNNPTTIKNRDLVDGPRRVTFRIPSSSPGSVSTQPTIMVRRASTPVPKYGPGIKPVSSQTSSIAHDSTYNDHTQPSSADFATTEPKTANDASESPVVDGLSLPANDDNLHLSPSVPDVGVFLRHVISQSETGVEEDHYPSPTTTEIKSSDLSETGSLENSAIDGADAPVLVSGINKTLCDNEWNLSTSASNLHTGGNVVHSAGPLTPDADVGEEVERLPFPRAKSQTRHPFAPFIRVKSPKFWTLPLLRLTPLPTPSDVDTVVPKHGNYLENIPFVSIADTPSRLPGPSPAEYLSNYPYN